MAASRQGAIVKGTVPNNEPKIDVTMARERITKAWATQGRTVAGFPEIEVQQ